MTDSYLTPYDFFRKWFDEACVSEPVDPDAACLATVDKDGMPDARVVLIRRADERGFCFFTNYSSQKGQELTATPKASINFHWKSLKRQVRIRGTVEKVPSAESDAYYNSRPLGSRIGAWASIQSQPLPSRQTLLDRVAEFENKFDDHPPRPDHWGGFRLTPVSIEFWQEGEFRLHDRTRYEKTADGWNIVKLYP